MNTLHLKTVEWFFYHSIDFLVIAEMSLNEKIAYFVLANSADILMNMKHTGHSCYSKEILNGK